MARPCAFGWYREQVTNERHDLLWAVVDRVGNHFYCYRGCSAVTARERTVIRAVIRALRAEGNFDNFDMNSMMLSYGLSAQRSKPVRNAAADLLEALVNDNS